MDVFHLIELARSRSASDIHLVAGEAPVFRVHGALTPVDGMPPLSSRDIEDALLAMSGPERMAEFERRLELDLGYGLPDGSRLRCNAARQRGTTSLAIRLLPASIPSIDALGLPRACRELVSRPRGLVIVSGPTGSGKSTTLAAMIQHLNDTLSRRVVTIEDPVEYVYTSRKCVITQRELGADTHSFAEALRHVLRQDPDVILVGEMRDTETAAAVLTVAETGHLVLTTGHAPSASQAMERVIDLFPPHERHLVQARLASLLVGALCQALLPRADGSGRVAAVEVMLGVPAVKNLIREGKTYQLNNVIQTGSAEGMQLLDQALARLYFEGAISYENMLAFCNDRTEMENLAGRAGRAGRPQRPGHNGPA